MPHLVGCWGSWGLSGLFKQDKVRGPGMRSAHEVGSAPGRRMSLGWACRDSQEEARKKELQ